MVLAEGVGHEVQAGLLDLDALAARVAQRQQLVFMATAMSQITSRLSLYLGVWMSRNRLITWEQQVPNRTGLRVLACAIRQILA